MKKLLISLAVLVGVALVADTGAAAYAEYRVSRELRTALSLSADPDVRINGFPFLAQAWAGSYRSVDVRASAVPVPGFGDVIAEATLRGVHVPTAQVLAGSVSTVVADFVVARVRFGATDLGRYLGIPDLEVSEPRPVPGSTATGPRTTVVLTGTVELLGFKKRVSVDATLALTASGAISVTATHLDLSAGAGPAVLVDSIVSGLLARLSFTIAPSAIPFSIVPTAVRAEGSEIVVEGTGTNVMLLGGRTGQ